MSNMKKWLALIVFVCPCLFAGYSLAENLKPFIQGDSTVAPQEVENNLVGAGYEIVGGYVPYSGATVIVVTNKDLRSLSENHDLSALATTVRVAFSINGEEMELSYSNPVYWGSAYRIEDVAKLKKIRSDLGAVLGDLGEFGTTKELDAKDLRKYNYTFGMEHFDDISELAEYDSKDEAIREVEKNLSEGAGGTSKVFRIDTDNGTVFGVGLSEGCSGDDYIMSRINKEDRKSTPHLPYEILVTEDGEVVALYARFRIAISWPHLPMVVSDTGATFFSIMCAPNAIEEALIQAAGGEL